MQAKNIYFGATRAGLFTGHEAFSVPISRIRCSKCPAASAPEYIAWADTTPVEADSKEASALLAELVEGDHPHHRASIYGSMTLEELRHRVGRKASPAES